MKQDVPGAGPRQRVMPQDADQTDSGSDLTSPALAALSAATDGYGHTAGSGSRRRRRSSLASAITSALLVGVALGFAIRPDYICAVTIQSPEVDRGSDHFDLRRELLDFASRQHSVIQGAGVAFGGWFVDKPAPNQFRFGIRATRRDAGLEAIRALADQFQSHMQTRGQSIRETPTDAELELVSLITVLDQRLDEIQQQVDSAVAGLSDDDPSAQREVLLQQWQDLRAAFFETRRKLNDATADAARLRTQSDPTHGLVSAEERRSALEADAALQQDLGELAVNLAELKLHLVKVWQHAAGPLEKLSASADDLLRTVGSEATAVLWHDAITGEVPMLVAAREYRQAVTAFVDAWNRRFTATRKLDVDPYRADMLTHYEQARRHLNDFLFETARRLTSMRSLLQELSADPIDSARFHVALSTFTRAFQTVQTAHHRFEFAAGAIETPDNFRIDIATRAARGLKRRSQHQIRAIERRLQQQAAAKALVAHTQATTLAEQRVERIRQATDQAIDDLVAVQEQLHLSAERRADFLRGSMSVEIAAARFALTRDYLDQMQKRKSRLAARRMAMADATTVKMIASEVIDSPDNLRKRAVTGGLGAGLTFIAMLLGQWWITRRD